MDGDADYMVNYFYYGVKILYWLTVDYIWIDQCVCICLRLCLTILFIVLMCQALSFLDGGNASIIEFIRL